jgi:hypothetical protein
MLMIEKDTLERAKEYAKDNRKSLSSLVETFLNDISKKDSSEKISAKLSKIVGSVKLPRSFDYKNEMCNYLVDKYI